MPVYRVVNKHHFRGTLVEQTVVDVNGNTVTYHHAGPSVRLEVGTLVHDLSQEEIAAFPDRFAVAEDVAMPKQIHPEVFALIRRVQAGGGTSDEQELLVPLMEFIEQHMQGLSTPESSNAMALKLADFGLDLFAEP